MKNSGVGVFPSICVVLLILSGLAAPQDLKKQMALELLGGSIASIELRYEAIQAILPSLEKAPLKREVPVLQAYSIATVSKF